MTTTNPLKRLAFVSLLLLTAFGVAGGAADDIAPTSASRPAAPAEGIPIVGTWRLAEDVPAPLPRRPLEESFSSRFVVRESNDAIEIDWTIRGATVTHRYAKDGSEETIVHKGDHGTVTSRHSGTWKDGRFTIKDSTDGPGPAGLSVTTVATLVLRRSGEDLLVERNISQPFPLDTSARYRRDGEAPRPPETTPKPRPADDPKRPTPASGATKGTIGQLSWLAGHWTGTSPASKSTGARFATLEEFWTPAAGGAMLATTRTVSGERMTEFEYLRIVERDGSLVFIAQPGGRSPTEFALSEITERSITVENADNDFPQRVTYRLGDEPDTLVAEISDLAGAKVIRFAYRRAK